MGGNASKVGFEAIVKQLTTKEVNSTDYEVSTRCRVCCDYDVGVYISCLKENECLHIMRVTLSLLEVQRVFDSTSN